MDVKAPLPTHYRSRSSFTPRPFKDEYDTMRVRFASIGPFTSWAEWDKIDRYAPTDESLVAAVEALLIHAHQPAYNDLRMRQACAN